ncbi:hypothetical protein BC629DRAFT_587288 [Irpex lacteus]|nr:hypothetical protein BC629DRAFT_587288 [Irpex lacteus]
MHRAKNASTFEGGARIPRQGNFTFHRRSSPLTRAGGCKLQWTTGKQRNWGPTRFSETAVDRVLPSTSLAFKDSRASSSQEVYKRREAVRSSPHPFSLFIPLPRLLALPSSVSHSPPLIPSARTPSSVLPPSSARPLPALLPSLLCQCSLFLPCSPSLPCLRPSTTPCRTP